MSPNGFVDGRFPVPESVEFVDPLRVTEPVFVAGAVSPFLVEPKNWKPEAENDKLPKFLVESPPVKYICDCAKKLNCLEKAI